MKISIAVSKAVTFCVILGLYSCSGPSYSDKYVSGNEAEFKQYQEETNDRPSPAARAKSEMGGASVYVTFSQPSVKERKIWGDLVAYDEVWRTGANEATVLSASTDLLVQGDTLKAGNYALYTIPQKDKWTVILNKKYDMWGAYDYDSSKDEMRFDIVPYTLPDIQEKLLFTIDETGTIEFKWELLGFKFYVMPI